MSFFNIFLSKVKEIVEKIEQGNPYPPEVYAVACLKDDTVYVFYTVGESPFEVSGKRQTLVINKCLEIGGKPIAELHTHPNGVTIPSLNDYESFYEVATKLNTMEKTCVCRYHRESKELTCLCINLDLFRKNSKEVNTLINLTQTLHENLRLRYPVSEKDAEIVEQYLAKVFRDGKDVKIIKI